VTLSQGGVFKIVALAQKAEYIWMDGQEGQKGIRFNEMRSKTKVIQKPIKAGSLDFPQWSFDGSRYSSPQPDHRVPTLKFLAA
jgi:hypothetical protein